MIKTFLKAVLLTLIFVGSANAAQLRLDWSWKNPDGTVVAQPPGIVIVGVKVLCGQTSGGPYTVKQDASKATSIVLPALPANTKYFCNVQSYTAKEALVSDPTKEVSAVTHAPVDYSIMDLQVPDSTTARDGSIELGMAITPKLNGTFKGVRFYKSSQETGTHTGTIWDATTKQPLATVTFVNETTSGWQEARFSTPIQAIKGKVYVVSFSSNVYHAMTRYGLSYATINGGIQTTMINGKNGFYSKKGAFPTSNYQNTNYFVDVIYIEN